MAKKQKKVYSFEKLEIGELFFQRDQDQDVFYFVSDKIGGKIYYTAYHFKPDAVTISKYECTLKSFHRSSISNAQKTAIRGELVKRLMEVSEIKS